MFIWDIINFFFATLNLYIVILLHYASNIPFCVKYVFFLPDIDECKINVCHHNASCTNTQGSYNCTCNPGYIGDGLNCKGRFGLFHAFQLVRASIQ